MIRPPNLPHLTVVLADPEEFTRRSTREILRVARVRSIVEAETGLGLARRLLGVPPCLVMLDVELPRFDSTELHAALRGGRHAVVLTARRITPDLVRASQQIASGGVLAKPYTPSRLWLRLETVVRRLEGEMAKGVAHV